MRRGFLHTRRAFTLPELLIVIIIIGLLSGLAIISYSGYRNYLLLRNASREITSALSTARSLAINNNGYYRAGFALEEGMFWIDEVDAYGNPSRPKVVHVKYVNELVEITSIVVGEDEYDEGFVYIMFYPDSTAEFSSIYLKRKAGSDADEEYYTIRLYPGTAKTRIYPNQRK